MLGILLVALLSGPGQSWAQDAPPKEDPEAKARQAYLDSTTRSLRLMPTANGLVNVSFQLIPRSDLERDDGGSVSVGRFQARAALPFLKKDKSYYISGGINYELHGFSLEELGFVDNLGVERDQSKNFHRVGVVLQSAWVLDEDWTLAVGVEPRLVTDFNGLSGDDFEINATAFANWAISDSFAFLFGVGLNRDFLRYLPVPLLGMVYRDPDVIFDMELFLPSYARASVRTISWLKVFTLARVEGALWHRSPEPFTFTGPGNVEQTVTVPDHFVKYFSVQVGGGLRIILSDILALDLHGGVVPFQRFEFRDANGNNVDAEQKLTGYFMANLVGGRF